jgi:hypothetical protein
MLIRYVSVTPHDSLIIFSEVTGKKYEDAAKYICSAV